MREIKNASGLVLPLAFFCGNFVPSAPPNSPAALGAARQLPDVHPT
ncbi:hypothetical protein [Chromatium okenii]|nr:hypothetical protein [Chromatium okenii]MBV5308237.1 hypothetical protein [Chromatium okenii]